MDNAGAMKKIEKFYEKGKTDKIVKFLDSKDDEVVCAAVEALGKIGDEESVNSVTPLIDSSDVEVRKAAIHAVGEFGTEYSKTLLLHRNATEQDPEVKTLILDMVHQINASK